MSEPDLLPLSHDLFVLFLRLTRRARAESGDELAPRHYAVLAQLKAGPSTARQLADVERVSAPAMTRTLNALEQLGYVSREPDSTDGRRTSVALTPEGAEVLERVRRSRDAWLAARIGELPDRERAVLAEAVGILRRMT
jgi:DNA-binding MarR family transcriptional regulator